MHENELSIVRTNYTIILYRKSQLRYNFQVLDVSAHIYQNTLSPKPEQLPESKKMINIL